MMRRLSKSCGALTASFIPCVALRFGSSRDKIVTVEDAVYLIPDNATITVSGFSAQASPEYILEAISNRYRETGSPKDLTLLFGVGPGDSLSRGLNHLAYPGLLKRVIGAHYGTIPMLTKMVEEGLLEGYMLPLGCISRMIRCAASGSPGHLTTVGFGTMVDPAFGGGKLNSLSRTTEDLVKLIDVEGKKYLFYKAIPIDVAVIRATTADPEGNLTMERESMYGDVLNDAMAARSRRGVVMAQVERVSSAGSLNPRRVRVPGTMVDCVVPAPRDMHPMSFFSEYNPAVTGEIRQAPSPSGVSLMPMHSNKIIARRAALELVKDQIVSLGLGMPAGVATIAEEEGILQHVEFTTEAGVHGGIGLTGPNFGPAVNCDALIEMHSQFDFYDGGGVDACFVGSAECDASGNVTVASTGSKIRGLGGFIDITQRTKQVNVLCTFTAGELEIDVQNGRLIIVKEGCIKKFVKKVKDITFSAERALQTHQMVNYITERAVFTLTPQGLELIEIAPGVDLEKDILAQMEFKPLIREPLGVMDPTIFVDKPMKLLKRNFALEMNKRIFFQQETQTLYVDLSGVSVYTKHDVEDVESHIKAAVAQIGHKVDAVLTYDRFDVSPRLVDDVAASARRLEKECYNTVRRVSSHSLARHKMNGALAVENVKLVGEGGNEENPMHTVETGYQYLRHMGLNISPTAFATRFQLESKGSGSMTEKQLHDVARGHLTQK